MKFQTPYYKKKLILSLGEARRDCVYGSYFEPLSPFKSQAILP